MLSFLLSQSLSFLGERNFCPEETRNIRCVRRVSSPTPERPSLHALTAGTSVMPTFHSQPQELFSDSRAALRFHQLTRPQGRHSRLRYATVCRELKLCSTVEPTVPSRSARSVLSVVLQPRWQFSTNCRLPHSSLLGERRLSPRRNLRRCCALLLCKRDENNDRGRSQHQDGTGTTTSTGARAKNLVVHF